MTHANSVARTPEARILVVDDEPNIVELLAVSLRFQGFEVATAASGTEGLDKARTFRPDALILDVMMPGMDGFGLIGRLRADWGDAPVLFLTAKDAVEDKVNGLTLGADDYDQAFQPRRGGGEVARDPAALRKGVGGATVGAGDLRGHRTLRRHAGGWKAGEPVSLSPTEFTLLRYLMVNAGTVLSKPRILDHVWNYDFGGEVGVVESYVSYLRRKVDTGETPLIHTLQGVGYVMREPRR